MQPRQQDCPTYPCTPINGSFPDGPGPVTPMSASFDFNDLPPRPGAPTPLTSLYGGPLRPNGQPTPLETPTDFPNLMTMSRGPMPGFIDENDPEAAFASRRRNRSNSDGPRMLTSLTLKARPAPVETVSESEEDILFSDDAGLESPISDAYDSPEAYDSAFESPSRDEFSGDELPLRLRNTTDDIFSDSEDEQWESFQQEDGESDLETDGEASQILLEGERPNGQASDDAVANVVTSLKNVTITEEAKRPNQLESIRKEVEAKPQAPIDRVWVPASQGKAIIDEDCKRY
ncbi:hypothetical protein BKA70DRAFT_1226174 [Coprinopsis sp. MPI-PUGE-AT-0042]|nr:hypothetical protein BKA70DRAFT_1226174 [Coprinopsis sp. MPI-PUGE-AT-0042]